MKKDFPALTRVGVLGCSDIACRRFLPALRRSERAVLAAIGSSDPVAAKRRLFPFSCDILNYETLLERADIDLIYLSLPNHLHEEWAIRALMAGKDLLCEKPLGLDGAAVRRMHEVAARQGRLLYENLTYLHHPQHAVVKELAASGRLGPLLSLNATFTIPALAAGNFRNDPERGGGAFHDQIRYPLSAAEYFFSGKEYRFRGRSHYEQGLITALAGTAVTELHETLHFSVGFGLPYSSTYELLLAQGSIRVERAFTTPADLAGRIIVTREGGDEVLTLPPADHFLLALDALCALRARPELFSSIRARNEGLAARADDLYRSCHGG